MTVAAWHEVGGRVPPVTTSTVDALADGARADLLVVGLGASGLAAVVAAADAGADVVGVDAVGIAAGAAGANGGLLLAGTARWHHDAVTRHGRDVAVDWYRRTLDELDRIEAEEPTFRQTGCLRTAGGAVEDADIRAHAAALAADGLPGRLVDVDGRPALLTPSDGPVHPVDRCRRLAHRSLAAGARLVAPAVVTAVRPGEVDVAELTVPVRARRVLVAVDGGLTSVVPELADRVDEMRLQMLATAPDGGVDLPLPRYHRHGLDWVQQLPTGEVLAGGGRDVGGDAESTGRPDAVTTDVVQTHVEAWLADLGVTAPVSHRWAARVAYTADRLPIDEVAAHGVHVVGAYSGHGNVIGGMLARRAALRLLDARDDRASAG